MSTKTLVNREDKKLVAKNVMISQRYLGIVLRRNEKRLKASSCDFSSASGGMSNGSGIAEGADESDWMFESGYLIFQEFQEENRRCYWNRTLIDSVDNVEFMGYVAPGTLLVCGNEYYLEALRSAWGRRVLKSPANFVIKRLGDVTGLEMQVIPQTQFTPLPEALCLVISDLNGDNETASLEIIFTHLQDRFCDMIVPNQEIVYSSLGKLIKDRKVYHTGDGYFIVTPETYHMTTISSAHERPLLMTNEEAIHKLHGGELMSPVKPSQTRTRSIQTNMDDLMLVSEAKSPLMERRMTSSKLERSGSLRLSRKEKYKSQDDGSFVRSESMRLSPGKSKSLIKDINLKSSPLHQDIEKGEKISVFSKLFRRSTSKRRKESKSPIKFATFSAQFPPIEWSDPRLLYYHSRSTQTLEGHSSRSLSSGVSPRTPPTSTSSNNNVTAVANGRSSSPVNNSSSSHNSAKSKADSLIRLREHERSSQRLRSSTNDSLTQSSTVDQSTTVLGTPTKSTSGLPRKILSHSCVAQDVAALQLLSSSQRRHSSSPKKHSSSTRASLSHIASPIKSSNRHASRGSSEQASADRNESPRRYVESTLLKSTNAETSANIGYSTNDNSNLHASAAALFKVEETKVKNTELRRPDEEYKLSEVYGTDVASRRSSSKCVNRWSVHGGEGQQATVQQPSSSALMNNVSGSPLRRTPGASANGSWTTSAGGGKCINKLHGQSSSSSSNSTALSIVNKPVNNITASVKPTQAIRPLTQISAQQHHAGNGEKVSNFNNDASLTPSPSFSKSFDLESTAFKSITAHKLLKGCSINSIDTLVEVNMAADECCLHNNGHDHDHSPSQRISKNNLTSPTNGVNHSSTCFNNASVTSKPQSVTSPPQLSLVSRLGKPNSPPAVVTPTSPGNGTMDFKDNGHQSQHAKMVAKQKMSYLGSTRSDTLHRNDGEDLSKSKIVSTPETTKVTALI